MKTKNYFGQIITPTLHIACFCAFVISGARAEFESRMAAPTKTPWSGVQRTASQTRWQSVTTLSNNVTRKASYRTNSFVELGAGLNITNASGQFVSANPSFTITPTGAEARGAAHQVIVPGDIGSGEGVRVVMPGGEELVFQPLAIDYFDPVDGQGVLLDVVTNAVGWLVASNEIVFSNCFTHIKASIRLRNTRAGLESDLMLHESPPEPGAFGLSSSARLEMLTEQLAGPRPSQRSSVLREERDPLKAAAMLEPHLVDTELTFGTMKMGAGRAFITPATTNVPPAARSGRVAKSFLEFDNRKIIIEAVEHRRVRPALLLLPPATKAVRQAGLAPLLKAERLAKNTRRLPALPVSGETREAALRNKKAQPVQHARLTAQDDATVQLASAAPAPAFVLDYYLVGIYGETDFTFRSDETYWVSCSIGLSGTTTIEGGTVIKFSEASGLFFFEEYDLVCDTTEHLPAVFTSIDDDSVGEDIGSGSPVMLGTWGLYFISGGSRALSNVRFTWLSNPIAMEGGGSANALTLRNVQVRKSDYVIDSGTTDISIYNGLFVDSGMLFSYADTFVGQHLTVHNTTTTALGGGGTEATIKNSLFVKVASPSGYGSYNISTDTANLSDNSSLFTTVEGGEHYLAASSIHRNQGTTTGLDAQFYASLPNLTTYAPEEITGTLTTDRTLSRRAIRDTDLPDRGYHYPAVDYLVRNVTVGNATLKMQNGVVVAGAFNNSSLWSPALRLNPGKLISQGTATRMNHLLRSSQIQENVQQRGYILLQDGQQQSGFYPELTLRFTELSSLADEAHLLSIVQDARRVEISHSALVNGQYATLTLYGGSQQLVGLTNNLFRRVEFGVVGNSLAKFYAYNNLFLNGPSGFTGGNSDWRINDNVFDHGTVTDDASAAVADKNAYVAGAGPLSFDATPVTLGSLTYASGPLGRYYVSGTSLQNAGSRDAHDAGLYYFTTQASLESIEENSAVDIGLHYVSLASDGSPFDSDGDTLEDYFEDANGNGAFDAVDFADWDGADCPQDIYETRIQSQSPYAWFKLNDTDATPDTTSLADAGTSAGSPLAQTTLVTTPPSSATSGVFSQDLFGKEFGTFVFDTSTDGLETGRDLINGGNGTGVGSISLLFRSLTGAATAKRYLLSQKGTKEFGVYFDANGLRVEIDGQPGGVPATIPPPDADGWRYGNWYYLALTWDETRDGGEVKWYLGHVSGTLSSGSINITDTAVVGNSSTVYVGCRLNSGNTLSTFRSPGNGALDQIAFWNSELTADQITAQFNALPRAWLPADFANFNWEILLPVDGSGSFSGSPQLIERSQLKSGFKYVDCTKKYFYPGVGNAMVFEVPYDGAAQNGTGPRSELRGTTATGSNHDWRPWGTHILTATCVVNEAGDNPAASSPHPNNKGKVIIGQIHSKTAGKPAVVLSYNFPSPKDVTVSVKYHPNGSDGEPSTPGNQPDKHYTLLTGVNLGDGNEINYTLQLVNNGSSIVLHATVNEVQQPVTLTAAPYDADWANQTFYFKAGSYYTDPPSVDGGTARVTFSNLSVFNTPGVSIAVTPSTVNESGMQTATLTLTRDQTDQAIQVLLGFGGSATLSGDYNVSGLNMDGTVTMAIGVASVNLTITPSTDALDEGASENVIVTVLPDPADASYGPAASPDHQITLTITDDD